MPIYMTLDDVRSEDHIDSRDLIELRESLASELEYTSVDSSPSREELTEAIAAIDKLAESGIEDWPYGAHFIADYAFEDYARELAEDLGAIDRDASWPLTYIDWPAAADALKMDYTTVDFLGTTYYVR
jgi:hypothetical protein